MVLAVTTLTDRLSPVLEVDGGRVEEDQSVGFSEQVTPLGEESLLDKVLVAAGSKRRLVDLLLA